MKKYKKDWVKESFDGVEKGLQKIFKKCEKLLKKCGAHQIEKNEEIKTIHIKNIIGLL
jgi:hypothetical protein